MMYDKLIKRLRNAAQWADKGLVITPSVCLEAADAIALLDDKPRWIPVTERLPEENGEYLVVYTLKAIPPIPRVEICSFAKNLRNVNKYDLPKNKPGFYQSDSEYGYYEITGVSHWLPLPEPPEEVLQ